MKTKRTVTLELQVQLTESEKATRIEALIDVLEKIRQRDEAKAAYMRDYRDEVRPLVEEKNRLAIILRDGTEPRDVKCTEEISGAVVVVTRTDTGESWERPIVDSERQTEMVS